MDLIGHIKGTDIQWVVEWWHISSMVHCCCLHYSTCRISRQFGERQGAPSGEGAFHTEVFTNRILGRLREA